MPLIRLKSMLLDFVNEAILRILTGKNEKAYQSVFCYQYLPEK